MKTFQSTPLTFIDQTDSRKLEVYIKSNLPTVQIFNQNTGAHTPDWREGEKLILSMDIFLDSRDMTTAEYNSTTIKWYKNDVEMTDGAIEDISDDKRKITIKDNILKDDAIITYTCEATYQGIVALSRITFTRVDSGLNGLDGADGTSVSIKGTASSVTPVSGTNYYTIEYSEGSITAAELGDSYVYNGDLYVCSVLNGSGTNDYFVNVGHIQGPKGDDAKSIILSGNSQVFKVSKTNVVSPSVITVVAQTSNTSINSWSYSTNGGQTFLSTVPSGVVRNGNIITITGSTLTVNSLVIKASDGTIDDVFTVYKTYDGVDGAPGDPGDPAPFAFLTNENITFSANAQGQITGTTITSNVVAYNGTTKVLPAVGTPTGMPTGMTISKSTISASNEIMLTITIANNSTLGSASNNMGTISVPITSPVSTVLYLTWSKVNTGAPGVGISSTTVSYGVSDASTTQPTTWQSIIPVVEDGKYLWTRTIIDYTDTSKPDTVTYTYAKQGEKGDTGSPGTPVTVASIQYQEGTSATIPPTGTWSTSIVAVAEGRFLWTKTTFSDGKIAYGVAKQGVSGTPASLVDITPSALYFKSTAGSTGTFEPQYIYLYPRFQSATYSNWQYSRDGGSTWVAASGANGLSIATYNSVANTLRVDRASTLYTDNITSISFRCNSTNAAVYDTVSIAKIYDVVDLQIGGRNLILRSDFKDLTKWTVSNSAWTQSVETYQGNRVMECDVTDREVSVTAYHDMTQTIPYEKLALNVPYTISFYIKCISNGNRPFTWYLSHITGTSPDNGWTPIIATTEWVKVSKTITFTSKQNNSEPIMYFRTFNGNKVCITKPKFEVGNTETDWSPAPEDLVEEAANVNVMLSNEAHFFEATAGGVPTDTSVTLDVVGYKGSVKSATTVGTIVGIPSAGMTATVSNNGTTNTKLTIGVTSALTSDIADYGILAIPVTVNGHTINKIFNWTKAKAGDVGAPGSDSVTFQVYSNNGYALSTNVPTLTLQTFAYIGDVEIQADATYQWYRHNNTDWVAVSGATNSYFNVSRDDVSFSNNYMCKMQFEGTEYVGVVTIEDKNDENKVFASKPANYFAGDLWIVGTDYIPSGFTAGTMLRAEHTNTTYKDSDWVSATKYDEEINNLKSTVDVYQQYFSVDNINGLRVGDASIKDNTLKVERVNTTTIKAKNVEVESPLTVTGRYSGSTMLQAPIFNLGNFSLVIEGNGSLSIVVNT